MKERNFKDRECLDCHNTFTPTNSRQVRCPECQDEYKHLYNRLKQRERNRKKKLLKQMTDRLNIQ